jgi:hypothetical protein
MSVGEILAWVRSFLDTMGLTPFITVFVIIMAAFAFIRAFRD